MQLARRLRAYVYDRAIVPMTSGWYRTVLERLPPGSHLLDVGIGTGAALLANADLLRRRELRVTGIDIDPAYVDRCASAIAAHDLGERVGVQLQSVYDLGGGPYDAVYFSASFMLLPEPAAALRHVTSLLNPGGSIYFTQTFEHGRSRALEIIKPLLRWVTTIDFGRVTYEEDFQRELTAGGLEIEGRDILHTSGKRSAVLVSARTINGS